MQEMAYNEFRAVYPQKYNLYYHSKATFAGYLPRREGVCWVEQYAGRHGTGYRVHLPRFDHKSLHYVEYWLHEEEETH